MDTTDNNYGERSDLYMEWPSKDAIDYTILHRWFRYRVKPFQGDRKDLVCNFMAVYITGFMEDRLLVPCWLCGGVEEVLSNYTTHQQRLKELLMSHYPTISDVCVRKVVGTFQQLVERGNATFNCIRHCPNAEATTANSVRIQVRPLLTQKLLNIVAQATPNASRIEEECSICMEAMIESTTTLSMPCSHTFHQPCLAQWLNNTRSCPLCRYPLPCAHANASEDSDAEEETDAYEVEETDAGDIS